MPAAPRTVAGDGETVRFVTYLLDQVQRRRIGRQGELVGGIVQVEGFQPRLAGHALGHAEQDQTGDRQFLEHLLGHGQLPLPPSTRRMSGIFPRRPSGD